jgi:hypothetical protein
MQLFNEIVYRVTTRVTFRLKVSTKRPHNLYLSTTLATMVWKCYLGILTKGFGLTWSNVQCFRLGQARSL